MSTEQCKKCGRPLPSYSVFCQACGYKVIPDTANQSRSISSFKFKLYGTKLALTHNQFFKVNRSIRKPIYIYAGLAIFLTILIYTNSSPKHSSKPLHITDDFICRAAIGAIFGRAPQSIKTTTFDNTVHLQYTRPSDRSLWKSKCKLSDNTVQWASTNEGDIGRWRNHEMDSKVTFVIDPKSYDITITQTHYDKSETVEKYSILDIDPTFDLELIPLITTKPTSSHKFLSEKNYASQLYSLAISVAAARLTVKNQLLS